MPVSEDHRSLMNTWLYENITSTSHEDGEGLNSANFFSGMTTWYFDKIEEGTSPTTIWKEILAYTERR